MTATWSRMILLLAVICGWQHAEAQSSPTLKPTEVVDRLHGIAYPAKEGWTGSPRGNAYLLHDNFHFILIRAARDDGDLRKMALLVTLLFPEQTDKSKLDEMVSLLRGVRFLSPKEMVSWRKEVVRDAEVGMEAATLHVPEGFSMQGGVIRQGTKRMPVLMVQKGEQMVRIDLVDVNSMMLQTGFGGNATTIITINGQSTQLPQPVMISSEEEVIQLLLALWEGETGQKWELKERQNLPKGSLEQQMESQMVLQMMKEHNEFNSRTATAWSNVLSDQTYVKDPQTAEVARVYKQSWESGGFWREPIFGDTLLGGVREGSRLEELLKMEGWRKLQESLEGFPQK